MSLLSSCPLSSPGVGVTSSPPGVGVSLPPLGVGVGSVPGSTYGVTVPVGVAVPVGVTVLELSLGRLCKRVAF